MIDRLRIQGFKSWADTGDLHLGKLTGFFGSNSSGKTALLQYLLMLKQTVETPDRSMVLQTGGARAQIDLGTVSDIVHGRCLPMEMSGTVCWHLDHPLRVSDPQHVEGPCLFETDALCYQSTIAAKARGVQVRAFSYSFDDAGHRFRFGMVAEETESAGAPLSYDLVVEGCSLERFRDRPATLPTPVKSYGFPDQVQANYRNAGFLPQFVLAFEELFQEIYYLGPIRDYPQRIYDWTRVRPRDVGQRGEQAVQALLAAERPWAVAEETSDYDVPSLEARVARWLRDLGLVESFHLERIGPSEDSYRVRVKVSADSPEVSLADVGFGVSQFLPVLILCYYVPEGATIILEQPELHLHPSVQAGLADVFIDVIKHRNVQIILESHSEHLVHRLRRRIAEQALASEDVDLYFVEMAGSESRIKRLAVDVYGNINNWPADFFGDRMGDLLAQTDAEMQRKVTKEPPQ